MKIDDLYNQLKQMSPETPLKTSFGTITNFEVFLNAHYSMLKANSGKWRFKPYYDRMLIVYNELKKKL
jgi:hypothetical protein